MRSLSAALAAVLLCVPGCREATPAKTPDGERPVLHLLTPLPLLWSETFGLDQPGSPAVRALEQDYRLTPIDLPSELPERGLLLAAQPRALPAEELVTLDAWVRRGGRLLLLADPMLEWPSTLALGDPRRAPRAFPDTGLLQHWGLRLDAPDDRGPVQRELAGRRILAASAGFMAGAGGPCRAEQGGFVARCALGKGRATIVADADFLNLGEGGLDGPTQDNLPALASELSALAR